MGLITKHQHEIVLGRWDSLMRTLDDKRPSKTEAIKSLTDVSNDIEMLGSLYSQINATSEYLRALCSQYEVLDKKTRGKMRILQRTFRT